MLLLQLLQILQKKQPTSFALDFVHFLQGSHTLSVRSHLLEQRMVMRLNVEHQARKSLFVHLLGAARFGCCAQAERLEHEGELELP